MMMLMSIKMDDDAWTVMERRFCCADAWLCVMMEMGGVEDDVKRKKRRTMRGGGKRRWVAVLREGRE